MQNFKIKTNYKYLSKNPISRQLVYNFNIQLKKIIKELYFNSLLDVGCGEGIIIKFLEEQLKNIYCVGLDLDETHIKMSKENAPFCKYKIGNIYNLPFNENSFEIVICLEVLEHLDKPEKALSELYRVSSKYVLISVPREPIWCFLNMARGKYWKDLGNTPGHINHYNSKKIVNLITRQFKIMKVFKPLPWTVVLGQKQDSAFL